MRIYETNEIAEATKIETTLSLQEVYQTWGNNMSILYIEREIEIEKEKSIERETDRQTEIKQKQTNKNISMLCVQQRE